MKVLIHSERIDITELPLGNRIQWNPILDELKSEHRPGVYQHGKRMGMNIVNGKLHAYIYRTAKTPADSEILEILTRHGIGQEVESSQVATDLVTDVAEGL
jgi:hypothetical protein